MLRRRDILAGATALAATPALAQTTAPQSTTPPPAAAPPPVDATGDRKPTTDPAAKAVYVRLDTKMGPILVELHTGKAPVSCANFLRYVDRKLYDGTSFYRATGAEGVEDFGVIQAGMHNITGRTLAPIAHEPTTKTGLSHTNGALSFARLAPGSATSDYFICLGDVRSLDANPAAKGDNLGFAVFGYVVEGMDVVRKIHRLPTGGKATNPVMKGQMFTNPVVISTARRTAAPAQTGGPAMTPPPAAATPPKP